MALTIEQLAAEPRWELARVLALPGQARGDLLGAWGTNVTRRFGAGALARLRRRLPPSHAETAAVLGAGDWVPVHVQLVLTEAIVDEFLDGAALALYPLLLEDTRAGIGRVQRAILRALGPGRAFKLGPSTFRKVHERGTAGVDVAGREAHLRFGGSPLFAHPTWRLLQVFATRVMLELVETPGTVVGASDGEDGFVAIARW